MYISTSLPKIVEEYLQFASQLLAVASAACLARVRRGKTSPTTTQPRGPQLTAKEAINMQADTIITIPLELLSSGSMAVPTDANMRSQAVCHKPPIMRGQRRPNFSAE
jgi:hypothetical protein